MQNLQIDYRPSAGRRVFNLIVADDTFILTVFITFDEPVQHFQPHP